MPLILQLSAYLQCITKNKRCTADIAHCGAHQRLPVPVFDHAEDSILSRPNRLRCHGRDPLRGEVLVVPQHAVEPLQNPVSRIDIGSDTKSYIDNVRVEQDTLIWL